MVYDVRALCRETGLSDTAVVRLVRGFFPMAWYDCGAGVHKVKMAIKPESVRQVLEFLRGRKHGGRR
jgi:hypothetical protein